MNKDQIQFQSAIASAPSANWPVENTDEERASFIEKLQTLTGIAPEVKPDGTLSIPTVAISALMDKAEHAVQAKPKVAETPKTVQELKEHDDWKQSCSRLGVVFHTFSEAIKLAMDGKLITHYDFKSGYFTFADTFIYFTDFADEKGKRISTEDVSKWSTMKDFYVMAPPEVRHASARQWFSNTLTTGVKQVVNGEAKAQHNTEDKPRGLSWFN